MAPSPSVSASVAVATADPCGTGRTAYFAARDEMPPFLTLADAPMELTTASIGLHNGSYEASDSIPGGVGLTADEPAVETGVNDPIRLAGPATTLVGVTASRAPWSTVDFTDGLGWTSWPMEPIAWTAEADGSISLVAPPEPGESLIDLVVSWETACLAGGGTAYGRVVVR